MVSVVVDCGCGRVGLGCWMIGLAPSGHAASDGEVIFGQNLLPPLSPLSSNPHLDIIMG